MAGPLSSSRLRGSYQFLGPEHLDNTTCPESNTFLGRIKTSTSYQNLSGRQRNRETTSKLAMFKDTVGRLLRREGQGRGVAYISREMETWSLSEEANDAQVFISPARRNATMPQPQSEQLPEQAALLGTLPGGETGDDMELKKVGSPPSVSRNLSADGSLGPDELVDTDYGKILVAVQGDRTKPAIVTYHDIGLNYVSNFQAFFNYPDMRILMQNFCLYHLNAPGQEENAETLPERYVFPTLDQMADQVNSVFEHFHLKHFVGLGVGAGANILSRFALKYPGKAEALCLLNVTAAAAGWIEWGYQKLNVRHLKAGEMTQGALDYLMWYHFGKLEEAGHDMVQVYRHYFEKSVNASNLARFIDMYLKRSDLGFTREMDLKRKESAQTIREPVLIITGVRSPHVEETVNFNSRLDPASSTWMKIQDCSMPLEEQPGKVSEAFRLFLQGQGYVPSLSSLKLVQSRQQHGSEDATQRSINIVENPIQEDPKC